MKSQKILMALLGFTFSVIFSVSGYATPSVEELNAQIQELMNRVKVLEAQKESSQKENLKIEASLTSLKKTDEEKKDSWTNNIKIAGDYRARFDEIYYRNCYPDRMDYGRWRVRIRLGFDAKINEDADFKLRFATSEDRNIGMQGNPVSTNLTLTNVASKKPVFIDVGQLDYHPSSIKGLHIYSGKIDLPFFTPGKSDLVWDHDITLEGATAKLDSKSGKFDISTALGAFMFMDRPESNDSSMLGGQVSFKYNLPKANHYITFGGAYYNFDHTKGQQVFDWQGLNLNYGNTKTAQNSYLYAYKELEYGLEAGWTVGTGTNSLPISVFGNTVKNVAADVPNNKGWLAGFSVGKLSKPGSLFFRYDYRKLEKDAVLGAITDSDSFGGGTNGKGHRFSIERQLMKNMLVKVIYFADKINIADDDKTNKNATFNRIQMEVQTKF
ncbi:MAG: putative porin [Candidatus Riflebacteria bacterium]|nr:putative porin [Candidatus Riflebacteria bacterium]